MQKSRTRILLFKDQVLRGINGVVKRRMVDMDSSTPRTGETHLGAERLASVLIALYN